MITATQPTPSAAPLTRWHTTTTPYQMESVVPSWLGSDSRYLAALKQTLTNRMMMQGWTVVEGPRVEDRTSTSGAGVPVGMSLLNVWCG